MTTAVWVILQLVLRAHCAPSAYGLRNGNSGIVCWDRREVLLEAIFRRTLQRCGDGACSISCGIESNVIENHALIDVDVDRIALFLGWRFWKSLVDGTRWRLYILICPITLSVLRDILLIIDYFSWRCIELRRKPSCLPSKRSMLWAIR